MLDTTERLERERDDAREAHRLTGQQLAEIRRRHSDYEGSRAAGFARRLWATKRRIRAVKKRLARRSSVTEQPEPAIVDASTLPPVILPELRRAVGIHSYTHIWAAGNDRRLLALDRAGAPSTFRTK